MNTSKEITDTSMLLKKMVFPFGQNVPVAPNGAELIKRCHRVTRNVALHTARAKIRRICQNRTIPIIKPIIYLSI